MGSLIFMVGGLICIAVSSLGRRVRKQFIAESFPVMGSVVDIKEVTHKVDNETHTRSVPVIEYKIESVYRFNAEIDADRNGIRPGDSFEVLVEKSNHKIARLKSGNSEFFLLMNILLFLGVSACGLSVYLFDFRDFKNIIFDHQFVALIIISSIAIFIPKIYPLINLFFDSGTKYTENAYVVTDSNAQ